MDLLKHFVTCAYDKFFIAWTMIHDEKGTNFVHTRTAFQNAKNKKLNNLQTNKLYLYKATR
jgi:hypothetical protein